MAAIATIICVAGIIALVYGAMEKLKSGRLTKTPFVKTGEAASQGEQVASPKGALSLEGDVLCESLLVSPVTGTECLYYELKVVGTWKDGDNTRTKDYVDEKSAAVFSLDDGSGPVPVRASNGGDFEPMVKTFDETRKEGFFADLKSVVGKGKPIMFGNYAFENPPMSKANKFQCIEKVLKPADRMFALGKHEAGAVVAPGWRSLILSHHGRDALMGKTAKRSKTALIGGGAGLAVGVILGIVSIAIAPSKATAAARGQGAVVTAQAKTAKTAAKTGTTAGKTGTTVAPSNK